MTRNALCLVPHGIRQPLRMLRQILRGGMEKLLNLPDASDEPDAFLGVSMSYGKRGGVGCVIYGVAMLDVLNRAELPFIGCAQLGRSRGRQGG